MMLSLGGPTFIRKNLFVHQLFLSLFPLFYQGSTPFPHCFGTAFTSDVTSQPNSKERGGASDSKTQTLLLKTI